MHCNQCLRNCAGPWPRLAANSGGRGPPSKGQATAGESAASGHAKRRFFPGGCRPSDSAPRFFSAGIGLVVVVRKLSGIFCTGRPDTRPGGPGCSSPCWARRSCFWRAVLTLCLGKLFLRSRNQSVATAPLMCSYIPAVLGICGEGHPAESGAQWPLGGAGSQDYGRRWVHAETRRRISI